MKNCNFQKNPLWENNQLNNNKLNDYKVWLIDKNFTKETIENYLATIIQYGKREVDVVNINNFFREIVNHYQPATLRSKRNALTSYCKFLKISIDWERIKRLLPTEQRKPLPTITKAELELLKTISTHAEQWINERDNLILDFLWYIGMRINELINIRHHDYCEGLLTLHGKGNKVRHVFLPDFLIKNFNPYSKDYFFLTRNGKRLTKGQIRRNMKLKARLAGIKKNISPHSFRRSLATNSHNLGVRLDTIQKQLGHTNLNTTIAYVNNDYQTMKADYDKLWII